MDNKIKEVLELVVDKLEDCDQATALKIARNALSLLTVDPDPREDAQRLADGIVWDLLQTKGHGWQAAKIAKEIEAYASRLGQKARADERRRCDKCCIKILKLAREKIQDHVNEIYSSGGVEYIGLGSTLDEIDKVLKELESNG